MAKEQFLSKLKSQAKEFLDPEGGLCTFPSDSPSHAALCQGTPSFDFDCSEGPHKHRAVCSSTIVCGQVVFRNSCYGCVLHREFLGSHCSSCFKREDEVQELKQCCGCKQTRYCSRACQQFDWNEGGHSRECKHLGNYTVLPSPQFNNLRLLVRVYFITYLKKKKNPHGPQCHIHTQCPDVVACGRDHLLRMSTASGVGEFKSKFDGTAEQAMANDVLLQATHVLMQPEGEDAVNYYQLLGLYALFNTNNFGIFNDLHQVIGSGVYPMTAILNHSCCPNIILTYQPPLSIIAPRSPNTLSTAQPGFPISQGVYCLSHPAEGGQELVHSYVDLCYPVLQRRREIFDSYNFNCECQRCVEQLEIYGVEWKWTAAEDKLVAELESLVDKPLLLKAVLESSAVADPLLRIHAVTERISTSSLSPLCFHKYRQNCRNFESSLADFAEETAGDKHDHLSRLPEAIRLCKRIISALVVFLSHVKFHPLLGLQLFTLGDLLSAAGDKDEASRYYTWCESQLQHTHAPLSPLLLRLKEAIHQLKLLIKRPV